MDLINILHHDGPQGNDRSITVASHWWLPRLHPTPSSCTIHFVKQPHHARCVLTSNYFHVLHTSNLAHMQLKSSFNLSSFLPQFIQPNKPENRPYVTKLANLDEKHSNFAWSHTIAMRTAHQNLGSFGVGQKINMYKKRVSD